MLVRALIVLVSTTALLSPPGASAAPTPAAVRAAAGDTHVATSTCSDGGRIRMAVERISASEVEVDVQVTGMQDDGRWEGGILVSERDGDPMDGGDSADFVRRPVDGAWHAAATLTAKRGDDIQSLWTRRGPHICTVGTSERLPVFNLSFCNGNDFGLDQIVRRTDRPGVYRVRLAGGTDWGAGSRWRLSISAVSERSTLKLTRVVRASRQGNFSMVADVELSGDARVAVRAAGPDGNVCRLSLRRDW